MQAAQQLFTPDHFQQPLDFLRSEHRRQLEISDWLIEAADCQKLDLVLPKTQPLLVFLKEEMPLHHRDEEEDLFPMLRLRCGPEDRVDAVLAELKQDHAAEGFLRMHIIMDLNVIANGEELQPLQRLFSNLLCFAKGQKQHLAWENDVVLRLADRRLTEEDLLTLGRNMALRRRAG